MKKYISILLIGFLLFPFFSRIRVFAEDGIDEIPIEEILVSDDSSEENSNEETPLADEIVKETITEEEGENEEVKLIINEIMIGSEINPEKDSWIEIYNPSEKDINLKNWQIRGVTSGGRWTNFIPSDEDLFIPSKNYFLFSYYSNSSYSALSIKPDLKKTSFYLNKDKVFMEIKNPNNEIVDSVDFLIEENEDLEFRSYERIEKDNEIVWQKSNSKINIKDNLKNTFSSPKSENLELDNLSNAVIYNDETEDLENSNNDVETEDLENSNNDVETEDLENSNNDETEDLENSNNDVETEDLENSNNDIETEEIHVQIPDAIETTLSKKDQDFHFINEFMVNPEGIDLENEWVELYNNTNKPVDINMWYIDDADGNSSPKMIIEQDLFTPNTFIKLESPYYNLSLKNSSDTVRLLNRNKEPVDIVNYKNAKENYTYAKKENGLFDWSPLPTFGAKNKFPLPPKAYKMDDVNFVKLLVNPNGKDKGKEFIVLKNNTDERINLSSFKIINQKAKTYKFNSLFIEANSDLKLNTNEISMSLVNKGDELSLVDSFGNLIDRISWLKAQDDQWIYKNNYFKDNLCAKVLKVIDGDTIKVLIEDEEFNVRLIGIDSPETVHPFKEVEYYGKEASDFLKKLIANKFIYLSFEDVKMDKYNRLLAYVYLNKEFINAKMIKGGFARAYTNFPFKYKTEFLEFEKIAKEAKIGLWENENIEEKMTIKDDNDNENDEEEVIEEKTNLKDDLQSELTLEKSNKESIECAKDGLKIEYIIPNPNKNDIEKISIRNISDEKICLNGWKLDDSVSSGSKIFEIKGGAINSSGIRNFLKTETKIALNNSNDCATLINPDDEIVDQICYNKTHKGEKFNHDGGDYVAKVKRKKKTVVKKTTVKSNSKPAVTSSINEYKNALVDENVVGKIDYIYEDGSIIYFKKDDEIIPVNYANTNIDISMAKEFLNLNKDVEISVRNTSSNEKELVYINQDNTENNVDVLTEEKKFPYKFFLLIFPILLFFLIRNYNFKFSIKRR